MQLSWTLTSTHYLMLITIQSKLIFLFASKLTLGHECWFGVYVRYETIKMICESYFVSIKTKTRVTNRETNNGKTLQVN